MSKEIIKFMHKGELYTAESEMVETDFGPENKVDIKDGDGDVKAKWQEAARTETIIRWFQQDEEELNLIVDERMEKEYPELTKAEKELEALLEEQEAKECPDDPRTGEIYTCNAIECPSTGAGILSCTTAIC